MNKTVVGIGEILWDVFPERKVLGGAPANFAYHVSQLGLNGYAVSAIGDDPLGEEILATLQDKQLNYLIEHTEHPTGTVQVTLNDVGIPQYEICENVAWDNIPFTEQTKILARKTAAVCFGSLAQRSKTSGETIKKFVQNVPADCLKIFDINLRKQFYTKEIIDDSLQMANILKINDDEIKVLADLHGFQLLDEQTICLHLLERFQLEMLILTKGVDGSFVFTPNETSFRTTPKVHVADTVGAGDSFTAAFVSAVMHGKTLTEAHQLAVEVSAYVCRMHGAMPKLPDEYIARLR